MGADQRANDLHRALLSLYIEGVPLDPALRPDPSGARLGAMWGATASDAAAVGERLRARPGIDRVSVVDVRGDSQGGSQDDPRARLELEVTLELADRALTALLRRPPLPRAAGGPQRSGAGAERSGAGAEYVVRGAQVAHARCHRHLRLLTRSTGGHPAGAAAGLAALEDDPRARRALTLIADQPRLVGERRLVRSPRALAQHLRDLTLTADSLLDAHAPLADDGPEDAGRRRLVAGLQRALADALHAAGAAAPPRC